MTKCKHLSLVGLFEVQTCKECNKLFFCKNTTVIGSSRFAIPYETTRIIPIVESAWKQSKLIFYSVEESDVILEPSTLKQKV